MPRASRKKGRSRTSGKCELCHLHGPVSVHHLIPTSVGGPNRNWNKVRLCYECHRIIHRLWDNPRLAEELHTLPAIQEALLELLRGARQRLGEIIQHVSSPLSERSKRKGTPPDV